MDCRSHRAARVHSGEMCMAAFVACQDNGCIVSDLAN